MVPSASFRFPTTETTSGEIQLNSGLRVQTAVWLPAVIGGGPEALGAGFGHVVLGLPAPFSDNVARWVADELITTSV
jgi:hypothetical protein